MRTSSGGKKYTYVTVDNYSRFTWVIFLFQKDEAFEEFVKLFQCVQNSLNSKLFSIRSDNEGKIAIVILQIFTMSMA